MHNVTKVGFEATGGYEKLCAYTLLSYGFEVYAIQPRWIRDYANSLGIAAKTDKMDCSIISRYINNTDMRVTPLKVSNVDCLKQKLSRRNQLVEMAKIQKTQAHQITDVSIIKQIEELLVILQNQIQILEDEMMALVDPNGAIQVITSPKPNEVVSGIWPIMGTADFDMARAQFFKLELGVPQADSSIQWVTLGDTHNEPVRNGQLELLYSEGLAPGTYYLRVIVINRDGNYAGEPTAVLFVIEG